MKLVSTALISLALSTFAAAQTGLSWDDAQGGTLAGSAVAVTGFNFPSIGDWNLLQSNDYDAAPLSATQSCMGYDVNSDWTASFSPALDGVLWYGKFIRGASALAGGPWVTYTFNHPFVILSGFSQATVVGTTLRLPTTEFHGGILQFPGSVSTLTCITNATSLSPQVCTFGDLDLPGMAYCFGDAAGAGCPCANINDGSNGDAGCANGVHPGGAQLSGDGSASVSADSLVLTANGLQAGQPGLFFRADNAVGGGAGVLFGDGLRCAGGAVMRLEVANADAAGLAVSSTALSSGLVAGDVRRYQYWYRNTTGSPCGAGFNLTNGYEVSWAL